MKNFTAAQEQFRKLNCNHCKSAFTPEGVKLLREEKDYWVVRVHCTSCQRPSGVAIVGIDVDAASLDASQKMTREIEALPAAPQEPVVPTFSSRREAEKFAELAPISANDVLDAHAFLRELGADWMRKLPRS